MSTGQVDSTQIPEFYKCTNVDESTGTTHTLYGEIDGKGKFDHSKVTTDRKNYPSGWFVCRDK